MFRRSRSDAVSTVTRPDCALRRGPVQWRMGDSRTAARVAGVVLAAGASRRMGRDKLLLDIDGQTLLRGSVERALRAQLAPVVVVLGPDGAMARRELDALDVQIELNPSPGAGMGGSLRIGLAALAPEVAAAVIMLPDMPLVTTGMLEALVERYRTGSAPLVVSEYGEVTAPPVLFDRALFPELAAATGDSAGRETVRRHRGEAHVLRWPSATFVDLDRPEDYDRIRRSIR
jgi:molybdenum cofactor cytidylyltransferase